MKGAGHHGQGVRGVGMEVGREGVESALVPWFCVPWAWGVSKRGVLESGSIWF